MKTPEFSIIIPYFNHGKFISEALSSVLEQTLGIKNLEIFIVDDASTDSFSGTQISKIKKKFPQIQILKNKENKGPAFSRNLAAKEAKGEFLLFLDADDKIDPTFCEKMKIVLLREKKAAFAYSFVQHFGQNNEVSETWNPYDFSAEIFENRLPYCAAIRRISFEKVGGFDEKLKEYESEDWDFWVKMGKNNCHGFCVPEPLFFYRQHKNLRLKQVQKNYTKVVSALRKRHRDLFRFWHVFFLRQKWVQKNRKTPKFSATRNFHRWPKSFQNIAMKFYEAELVNPKNWKKAPFKCVQIMTPISIRKKLNEKFGREVFSENTKFSDFFPEKNFELITEAKEGSKSPKTRETIIFIIPWLPMGGVETLFRQIFARFYQQFDFLIFTTQEDENAFHSEIAPFATIFHLPNLFAESSEQSKFVSEKIKKTGAKKIFIVNSFLGFKWMPKIKTIFPNTRFFTILHGYLKDGWDFVNAAEMYFPFFEKIICVSEDVKTEFLRRLKSNGTSDFARIECIENTIDFERLSDFSKTSQELPAMKKTNGTQKNIVFCGRYNWDKNPHFFLDVAQFFVETLGLRDYKFLMFGEGPQKKDLLLRAKKINRMAEEEIISIGEKQNNIASIFKAADASVNCSPSEGFGLAICESLYFGVPVVAFDLEVFERFKQSKIFFTVSEKTKYQVEIFAQKIFMATEKTISDQQKKDSKKWVEENFSVDNFFKKYGEVFED